MKNPNIYSFESVKDYLLNYNYVRTYRQKNWDAYHHYKTNEYVLIPFEEGNYTERELLDLFQNNKGTELPAEIEICRFKLYNYQQLKK